MAKAKPDTPKKGKKSATVQKAVTALRRSPRKAVQSAKKLAAEDSTSPGKVVKRTAAKKTPVAAKASAKAKTPAKSTAKPKAAVAKSSKSPSIKKQEATTIETEPLASPKRGRPKKKVDIGPSKTKAAGRSLSKVSSRTRSQTPEDATEVSAPFEGNNWTDSPKKRSPSKTGSKKVAAKSTSTRKKATASATKAAPVTIRESIELPETEIQKGLSSTARKSSASPARGRSSAIASSKARATSKKSAAGSKRTQSRSPAGKSSQEPTVTASTRAQSQSPVRKTSSRARSQSPAKRSPKKPTISDALKFQDAINLSTRRRSASPAKHEFTREQSRLAAQRLNEEEIARISARSARARSKSPSKSNTRKASQASSTSPTLPPPIQSPKPRGRPRGSSLSRQMSPIRVQKTRTAGSPTKGASSEPRRSRSASPKKSERSKSGTRKLSDPAPKAGPGRPRGRSTSPSKPGQRQTQVQRRPSTQAAFEKRFLQNDDYGQALKRVERTAYRCQRDGKDPMAGRHPHVSKEDETMAKERGIRRAELEKSLHSKGALLPRRDLSATSVRRRASEADDLVDAVDGRGRASASPQRRKSFDNQRSPQRRPSRKRSASKSPNKDDEDIVPLPRGQPSGKGRGAIHSVTNPEFIPETSTLRKNPFFETMPAPEVWHRRMPPFLPFGETPFMEREMSRQITEDLARGAEKAQSSWSISKLLPSFGMGKKSPTESRPYRSPWTLPVVDESDVNAAMNELRDFINIEAGMGPAKRKASAQLLSSPVKRARRRSSGDRDQGEYRMSGAL